MPNIGLHFSNDCCGYKSFADRANLPFWPILMFSIVDFKLARSKFLPRKGYVAQIAQPLKLPRFSTVAHWL